MEWYRSSATSVHGASLRALISASLIVLLTVSSSHALRASAQPAGAPKNVLYLIVDDLRPVLNVAYKQDYVVTPAFDKLANESLVFSRAFCQIAVCAPSRSSFMSGVRPDATGIFNFANNIRDPGQPQIVTLPEQFKKHNYTVLGGGKTFHYDHPPYFDDTGKKGSWSSEVQPYYPFLEYAGSSDFAECPKPPGYVENSANLDPQTCALDIPMDRFYDYRLSDHTISSLKTAKEIGKPFFVMAGFRRPHRVFMVQKRFWDLYPQDTSTIHVAKVQRRDPSQPEIAFHHGDFTLPNGSYYPGNADLPWPTQVQQIARKGYYAAVSQTDFCIGRVLDELQAMALEKDTLVVAHADHGWQLGERGEWDKQTLFDTATRVPLMIKVPWKPGSQGQRTASLSELVDMHPTVAALAGVPFTQPMPLGTGPAFPRFDQAFGTDLSPLFDQPYDERRSLSHSEPADPSITGELMLKNASWSQWPSCGIPGEQGMCISPRSTLVAMGYSVRVYGWRYTAWVYFNTSHFVADWNATQSNVPPDAGSQPVVAETSASAKSAFHPLALELYDHRKQDAATPLRFDFDDDGEVKNLANLTVSEKSPEIMAIQEQLHVMLLEQFTYPNAWLDKRKQQFIKGQLSYDKHMGFEPYD